MSPKHTITRGLLLAYLENRALGHTARIALWQARARTLHDGPLPCGSWHWHMFVNRRRGRKEPGEWENIWAPLPRNAW
jgi:hypothetical protein